MPTTKVKKLKAEEYGLLAIWAKENQAWISQQINWIVVAAKASKDLGTTVSKWSAKRYCPSFGAKIKEDNWGSTVSNKLWDKLKDLETRLAKIEGGAA